MLNCKISWQLNDFLNNDYLPWGKKSHIFKIPTRLSISLSILFATPGYWILIATSLLSNKVAKCTWPIEAAANGFISKFKINDLHSWPNSFEITFYNKSMAILIIQIFKKLT